MAVSEEDKEELAEDVTDDDVTEEPTEGTEEVAEAVEEEEGPSEVETLRGELEALRAEIHALKVSKDVGQGPRDEAAQMSLIDLMRAGV